MYNINIYIPNKDGWVSIPHHCVIINKHYHKGPEHFLTEYNIETDSIRKKDYFSSKLKHEYVKIPEAITARNGRYKIKNRTYKSVVYEYFKEKSRLQTQLDWALSFNSENFTEHESEDYIDNYMCYQFMFNYDRGSKYYSQECFEALIRNLIEEMFYCYTYPDYLRFYVNGWKNSDINTKILKRWYELCYEHDMLDHRFNFSDVIEHNYFDHQLFKENTTWFYFKFCLARLPFERYNIVQLAVYYYDVLNVNWWLALSTAHFVTNYDLDDRSILTTKGGDNIDINEILLTARALQIYVKKHVSYYPYEFNYSTFNMQEVIKTYDITDEEDIDETNYEYLYWNMFIVIDDIKNNLEIENIKSLKDIKHLKIGD